MSVPGVKDYFLEHRSVHRHLNELPRKINAEQPPVPFIIGPSQWTWSRAPELSLGGNLREVMLNCPREVMLNCPREVTLNCPREVTLNCPMKVMLGSDAKRPVTKFLDPPKMDPLVHILHSI
jgi:hypothetical protein